MRANTPAELTDALIRAKAVSDRPVVIDCVIPTSENVYPMIPSGQSIEEMMVKHDLEELKVDVHKDGSEWSFSDQERVLAHYVEVVNAVTQEATEG